MTHHYDSPLQHLSLVHCRKRGDLSLTQATVGGWVRIFGRFGDHRGRLPTIMLQLTVSTPTPTSTSTSPPSSAAPVLLSPANGSANDLWFALPDAGDGRVGAGTYSIAMVSTSAVFRPSNVDDALITVTAPPAVSPTGIVRRIRNITPVHPPTHPPQVLNMALVYHGRGAAEHVGER